MIGAILAFLGGFASAVFAEPVRRWLFRPILALEFKDADHFIANTFEEIQAPAQTGGTMKQQIWARFVRVKVTNTKNALARSCRPYLVNIEHLGKSGNWE